MQSALASRGCDVEVLLVDNGGPSEVLQQLGRLDGVRLLEPGRNTGFAGGCDLAAGHATGDVLVLLNDDAVVREDTLAELAAALHDPSVGAACASVRLAQDERLVNTEGNPLHFTGLSWAGGHGSRASAVPGPAQDVPLAAGTVLALRRETWERLGGLWEEYFAYHEDVDLSWRCWQLGLRCVMVPTAVAVHRYEFSRTPTKNYLLERNRLLFLLTTFERRTLLVLAPALLLVEVGMLVLALQQGWAQQKLQGLGWLVRHRRMIAGRRREVQAARVVGDEVLVRLLTGRLDPTNVPLSPAMRALDLLLRGYWAAARPALTRLAAPPPRGAAAGRR